MGEVLGLQYNASTETLLVQLDALDENGGVVVGAPLPTVAITLEEFARLDGQLLVDDIRGVLARLEPALRRVHGEQVAEVVADPSKLTAKLAELATANAALEQEKLVARATVEDETRRAAEVRAERDAMKVERDAARADRDAAKKEAEDARKEKAAAKRS